MAGYLDSIVVGWPDVLLRHYTQSGSGREDVQLTLLGPDGRAAASVDTDESTRTLGSPPLRTPRRVSAPGICGV